MLCKTSVARQVFLYNYKKGFLNADYRMYRIDAKKHFGASVDACLFLIDFKNGGNATRCQLFQDIDSNLKAETIGICENSVIANIDEFLETKDLVTIGVHKMWRSGIKHDATKIMELIVAKEGLKNSYGEIVDIENEYLFPLLKSSDLANGRLIPRRYVIVTQNRVGEDTASIQREAPKLWRYLNQYSIELENRKSSIYKKQPKFSIFGVGDYSFKPFKIAVSSMYKSVQFCLLKPFCEKPVMVDDTCYLIGFDYLEDAEEHLEILKSDRVKKYIHSLTFLDAKRPVNSDILKTIGFKDKKQVELWAV